jgi:hypothetical protein
MIDMLYKRMDGNLNEQEDGYLSHILSELKMNYIEEKKLGDDLPEETTKAEKKTKKKPKQKTETKAKKPATKKTAAKTKDKK